MPTKYAVRIVDDTLDLIEVLWGGRRPVVKEYNTYFLFTIDSPSTTTDHDVVHEDDLYNYDGNQKDQRHILL